MLKTLGRETKGFRLVSVLTPIFMIAEVIMEMIIPKLMASIIDNGVTPGNMQVIYTVGAQMVVAALFGLLFGILGAVAGSHAATGFARNLRRGMFRNIQTFSFANIDKYSTAGLVTRMTTDVTNIQNAYQHDRGADHVLHDQPSAGKHLFDRRHPAGLRARLYYEPRHQVLRRGIPQVRRPERERAGECLRHPRCKGLCAREV